MSITITASALTYRCRTGNHEGCTGRWHPEEDELVICSCECHRT